MCTEDGRADAAQRTESAPQPPQSVHLSLSLSLLARCRFPPLITCLITDRSSSFIHSPGVDQHLGWDSGTTDTHDAAGGPRRYLAVRPNANACSCYLSAAAKKKPYNYKLQAGLIEKCEAVGREERNSSSLITHNVIPSVWRPHSFVERNVERRGEERGHRKGRRAAAWPGWSMDAETASTHCTSIPPSLPPSLALSLVHFET